MTGEKKHSPQSAQRSQRKALLLVNVEITVPWFVDPKFLSVPVLRDLCASVVKPLLGLRQPRYVSIRQGGKLMSEVSGLILPEELLARIEQAARERGQNPSTLIARAVDLLLEAEASQAEEARRRLASRTGKTVPNERVVAWLDTWGLDKEIPPPQCE
jgi:predicted transcriptional regulator